MNRIFWNGNESHSRNLGVSPASMAVAHSLPQDADGSPYIWRTPGLSQERRAYESYAAYSRRIGAPVLDFESWYRKDCGIGGTLFANYLQFHGMTVKDVGRQDHTMFHRQAPNTPGYDGSWDNAVKMLEAQ